MSGIYDITVTTAGASLLSQATAGTTLEFTRAQLGSGIVTGTYTARTALSNPVCYTSLDTATAADGVLSIPAMFSNKSGSSFLSAFTINEIGLFGKVGSGTETLIAYANAGSAGNGIAIPGDTLTELSYVFKIAYSGAATVTVSASAITYVQKEYVDTQLATKANTSHTHVTSDVTDLQTALDAKAAKSHTHSIYNITNLSSQLANKANTSHTQAASTITSGTLGGKVLANASSITTLTDKQVRNIVISTTEPSSATNGDIWLSYS